VVGVQPTVIKMTPFITMTYFNHEMPLFMSMLPPSNLPSFMGYSEVLRGGFRGFFAGTVPCFITFFTGHPRSTAKKLSCFRLSWLLGLVPGKQGKDMEESHSSPGIKGKIQGRN
jgi:hypothetical protein